LKNFKVITLFPESCEAYTDSSILKRAHQDSLINVSYFNPRDYTVDKNHRLDQKPYGGGPGMVLEAEPFLHAWHDATRADKGVKKLVNLIRGKQKTFQTIFFSPSGTQFDQTMAIDLANSNKDLIFLCGRYEGLDYRVVEATNSIPISIGPYTLTGGELPALSMIDAITRHIPGVLGDKMSLEECRISSARVYTKPRSFKWQGKKYDVPEVLFSGNHAEIDNWRSQNLDLQDNK
jgi:tRNA (guanine37-N1)-methyltransferase